MTGCGKHLKRYPTAKYFDGADSLYYEESSKKLQAFCAYSTDRPECGYHEAYGRSGISVWLFCRDCALKNGIIW